jgi:hypothetical protein
VIIRKYLEKELFKQITYMTGRKPHIHESLIVWYQMKKFSDAEVLTALVEANRLVYTKKLFLGR